MKTKKLLSVVLSLALVFSMIPAFGIAAYADEGETPDGAQAIVTPETIWFNNEFGLEKGDALYNDGDTLTVVKFADLPKGVGYAYYNKAGVLELHNLKVPENKALTIEANAYEPLEGEYTDELDFLQKMLYNEENNIRKCNTVYVQIFGDNELEGHFTSEPLEFYGLDAVFSCGGFGGSLDITNEYEYGIYCDNLTVLSGKYSFLTASDAIKVKNNLTINGGEFTCEESCFAESENGNININGGKIELSGANNNLWAGNKISVNGGILRIAESGYYGFYADYVLINGGSVEIINEDESNCYGIFAGKGFIMEKGSLKISYSDYGVFTNGNLAVNGGTIDVAKAETIGLYSGKDITLKNCMAKLENICEYDVEDCHYGVYALGDVDIDSAVINVKAAKNAIKTDSGTITIADSDVKALSDYEDSDFTAISPKAVIEGRPLIYAGDTEKTAKILADKTKNGDYRFVHITKGQNNIPVIQSIQKTFVKLIAVIGGIKAGKFLIKAALLKNLLAKIF